MQILFNIVFASTSYILAFWLISSILFGLYIKSTGYTKWYLACIPIVNLWVKHEIGTCNLFLLAVQCYCTCMLFVTGPTYLTVIAIILKAINDLKFAKCMLNKCNPVLFAFIPFIKYLQMFKETRDAGV